MHNNSKAAAKRTQVVMSEKAKTFVSKKTVTTKSGKKISVNVYKANKNAKPIRTIVHRLPPPTGIKVVDGAKTMGQLIVRPLSDEQQKFESYTAKRREKFLLEKEARKNRISA